MQPNGSVTYVPRQDTTPEKENAALATIYRLTLDCGNTNAVDMTSTDGSDAMKGSKNDRARTIIPADR